MRPKDILMLRQLTELVERREMSRLDDLRRAEEAVAREVAAIADLHRAAARDEGRDTARAVSGADRAWSTWLALRHAHLARGHAMARAEREEATAQARLAFLRRDAAVRLERAASNDAADRLRRRDALRCEMLSLLQRRN